MPSRYADVSHSGKTDVASTRTPNSLVWGTTKAIELVSSVRFSWDNHQNRIFIDFLKAVGPDLKDVDIEPLLFQLDLHGYDNIRNKSGESVYRLIKEKVMRKLKRTADKMEMNGLFESDIESSSIDPEHNVFKYRRDSIDPKIKPEYTEFTQPIHPFLKIPQQKVRKGILKNATYEDSTYMSETSYPGSQTQRASHASHLSPQKNGNTRTIEEAKYKRARQSIRDLVFELSHTEKALKEAASAFNDLQPIKKGEKWTGVLNRMILTHYDVQLDGAKFYEFAKKNL
ncbi:hypothetical protein F4815DRAFT_501399 [Daldinia loculata]|uniref:uncharacterized protein n=1 Tax=Daldinia loculata TaxID=103429 RepID=UPI0020C3F9B3|nr:uncharacterized protein F4817DRAFT_363924 [Daldinia loculata]KAI1649246.1 hypothetical protein F4817DRAFT_363924 [Daldinia loculata]KAI2778469.1 hypothetical protein F4815DRAFT_501399 [Daldinia loculata]